MDSIANKSVSWPAYEGEGRDDPEISSMPPRMPSPMVAQDIVVWTPTRFLDAALSRLAGVRRPPQQRPAVRVVPQIDLAD